MTPKKSTFIDRLLIQEQRAQRDLEELRPGNILCDVYGHDNPIMNELDQYDYLECAGLIGVLPMVVS